MSDRDGRAGGRDGQCSRRYLLSTAATAAVAGLAGCSGGDGGAGGDGGDDGSNDDGDSGPSSTGADVVLVEDEFVANDAGAARPTYVDATVENRGDERSGMIGLTVTWLDGSGDAVGEDLRRLPTLDAGETWIPHVDPVDASDDAVEDYEASLDYVAAPAAAPTDTTVTESQLAVDATTASVTGRVENGDDELSFVEVQTLLYDDQGRVLTGNWDGASDLPAGQFWEFELRIWARERAEQSAVNHETFLASDSQSGEL